MCLAAGSESFRAGMGVVQTLDSHFRVQGLMSAYVCACRGVLCVYLRVLVYVCLFVSVCVFK